MSSNIKSNHKKYKKTTGKNLFDEFSKKEKDKKKGDKKSRLESISNGLNIPTDILAGASIVTVMGNNQLSVENYKGILEYTGDMIRIQAKHCRIHIEGKSLNIDYFTDDEMKVSGRIRSIKYSS